MSIKSTHNMVTKVTDSFLFKNKIIITITLQNKIKRSQERRDRERTIQKLQNYT